MKKIKKFFFLISKADKLLFRLRKKKRQKTQYLKDPIIKKREITTDITEIQKKKKIMRILQAIICQQFGQPRRTGQISRNM